MKKKGIFGLDELPGWVIALLVLGLMLLLYKILGQKGSGILEFIKNKWKYG